MKYIAQQNGRIDVGLVHKMIFVFLMPTVLYINV